jgi:TonB-linked SusC/RagA family outer membrane protein
MKYVAFAPVLAAVLLSAGGPEAAFAQQGSVRGTVTSAQTGEPIVGAQIAIRGTAIGTITTEEGRFLLTSVPPGRTELRVEFLGYAAESRTITVSAGQTETVDVALRVSAIQLDELVATGYGQQTRGEVSTATSSVAGEQVQNNTVASVDAALAGRASGVQVVQNAGNPGNGISVRVRGSSSISADNQPLVVVDGVPIFRDDFSQLGLGGQDLSAVTGLNPDEIESIDILKDAAAAAIYGSRGSNGVLMITTKRGVQGTPRFTFGTQYGQQKATKQVDLLNTAEWIQYFSAAMANDGYTPTEIQEELDAIGVNPSIDTDWQDEVLRSAPVFNTQLSMSGGTERFKYLVSGSYFDQTGIITESGYARSAGRVNLDFQASERLNLSASLALSHEDNDRVESDNSINSAVTNAIANEPWTPVYNEDGTFNGDASYANPVATGRLTEIEARTIRSFGNLTANFGITDWLRATGRAGFDFLNLREFRYDSPDVPLTYASGVDGVSRLGNSQGRRTLLEGFLSMDRFIGAHEFSLTGGASIEQNDRENSFLRGEGFTSTDLHWPTNAARPIAVDGTRWDHNLISYFSRANYSFDNRYVVNASLRRDGSSRFGQNDRYGTFPAVSAAWLVSNEAFMQDMAVISNLRLRGSWGETGNEAIGNFQFLGLYESAGYGDIPGTAPDRPANPDLKWEKTREWNVGLDVGLLSDRVGIVGELYRKNTTDLLLNRPITGTSGFTSILANVGEMQNRGWELSLRTVNIQAARSGGLGWTSELHVTHNTNEVVRLFSPDPAGVGEPFNTGLYSVNRVEEGQPLGAFHLIEFLGVDPATGDALYADLDDDGNYQRDTNGNILTTTSPTSGDRTIVGSPHPDYFGGLRNTLSFGAFDLSAFLEFSQGAEIYNAMRRFADDGGYYFDNKFGDVMDYWTPDNPNASSPRPSYFGRSGARQNSSRFIEDASYLRLQDITFGFQLPASIANLARVGNARIYVSGKNVKTWSDYTGYSPDVNSGGSGTTASLGTDFYAYPMARTFTIGFQGTW